MSYSYKASETFWESFYALNEDQKETARAKWDIFKINPFDARLGTHKINKLSSRYRTTVYGIEIEGNLRCVFKIDEGVVYTIDIGTHDIYK